MIMGIRKPWLAGVLLTLCMLQPPVTQSSAQQQESSATLQETTDWITSTIEAHNMSKENSLVTWTRNPKFSGCRLKFGFELRTVNQEKEKPIDETWDFDFSLGDLDPAGIQIKESTAADPDMGRWAEIRLYTSKNARNIRRQISDTLHPNRNRVTQDDYAVFRIDLRTDQDRAKRLKRAFEHVIKLCGGKVDPF
jgi:hypothetical protein